MMPPVENLVWLVCVALAAVLVIGGALLIRKHGGLKNAMFGGEIRPIGQVKVGSVDIGTSEFRLSTLKRPQHAGQVILEISRSAGNTREFTTQSISISEAAALATLIQQAANEAKQV